MIAQPNLRLNLHPLPMNQIKTKNLPPVLATILGVRGEGRFCCRFPLIAKIGSVFAVKNLTALVADKMTIAVGPPERFKNRFF
jgi:hypothetical protein